MATSMDDRRSPVGEWSVQVARRHEHLLYRPIIGGRCKGEQCELWLVDTQECAITAIAKGLATNGGQR